MKSPSLLLLHFLFMADLNNMSTKVEGVFFIQLDVFEGFSLLVISFLFLFLFFVPMDISVFYVAKHISVSFSLENNSPLI